MDEDHKKMKDENKTKKQLINELGTLRRRIAELESFGTDRRQAESVLKKRPETSETLVIDLLDRIFASIHILAAYLDRHFNFLWVNKAYADAGGHSPEFFIGKNHFDLYPHDEENETIFRKVVETGEPYHTHAKPFEYSEYPEKGVTFWDWSLVPVTGAEGKIDGLILTLLDVTEAKKVEATLLESEKKFRLLAETIEDVFWISTPGIEKMLYVSPAYEKIWGSTLNSLYKSPTSFVEAVHPQDRERVSAELQRHAKGQWNIDYRIVRPDGSVRWIYDRGFQIQDEAGNLIWMCGVATDITERKQTEKELNEAKILLEKSFEALDEVVFVVDPADRTIIACNPAIERVFGYSPEEVLGRNTEFLHINKDMYKEFGQTIFPALDRMGTYSGEFMMKRKDGSILPSEHTIKEIADDSGQPTWLISVVRDLSESKRYEEQLKAYIQRLEQSNKELEEFAFVASHDLQEPLRKIQAFGDRLIGKFGDSLNESGRDYLERMLNASKRMQDLIDGLLTYSRVATKAQPFVPVNMNEVIQKVLSNLETRIDETGGTVAVDDLPTLEADPNQMLQLMQNLISNALNFHQKGIPPAVKIGARPIRTAKKPRGNRYPPGEACEIRVEDNGIGFDGKYLDRMFMPFQRLHGRSEYEGVGMGLAICRKIIERHGGNITAESTPGTGSTFILTIPARLPKGGDSYERF
jgi:PAS domain S-box-containing protein